MKVDLPRYLVWIIKKVLAVHKILTKLHIIVFENPLILLFQSIAFSTVWLTQWFFFCQTYTAQKGSIAPTPTSGKPSVDTHVLRDDSVLTDHHLQTRYVVTPVKPTPGRLHVWYYSAGTAKLAKQQLLYFETSNPWGLTQGFSWPHKCAFDLQFSILTHTFS